MNSSPPERGPDHDAQDSGRKRGSRRRPPLPSTLLPGSGDVGGNTTAAHGGAGQAETGDQHRPAGGLGNGRADIVKNEVVGLDKAVNAIVAATAYRSRPAFVAGLDRWHCAGTA